VHETYSPEQYNRQSSVQPEINSLEVREREREEDREREREREREKERGECVYCLHAC
jgi:hypothetical protein